jgi:hypothetical protein
MLFFRQTADGAEAFSAANELLKLAVRRLPPHHGTGGERVFCYHSWRAALTGIDAPLDDEELPVLSGSPVRLLHLVATPGHREVVRRVLGHHAIVLPLTTLQDPDVYRNTGATPDFDIFFSCMFTAEHMARKNVGLLRALLDRFPTLRVAWVGGYDPYERWLMEDAFNRHLDRFGPAGPDADPPWREDESSFCWYLGGGVFSDEVEKQRTLRRLIEESARRGHRIQFYANLSRDQVVHLLNRCRGSLSLSRADQWPRVVTEALACGTPAVAVDSLLLGLDAITPESGAVVGAVAEEIMAGLERAWSLPRDAVRRSYYERFGLDRGITALLRAADDLQPGWSDIVTVERPAETRFKRAVRSQIERLREVSPSAG